MIRPTTRAGAAASASRPPLIAERCLRTQLISAMSAPLLSSARLIACLSSRVRPGAGSASSAEPPPEIRHSTRSSALKALDASRMRAAAASPAASGVGCAASTTSMLRVGAPMAVAGDDEAFERPAPRRFDRGRHRRRGLAGADDDRAPLRRRRQEARERLAGEAASIAASNRARRNARGSRPPGLAAFAISPRS